MSSEGKFYIYTVCSALHQHIVNTAETDNVWKLSQVCQQSWAWKLCLCFFYLGGSLLFTLPVCLHLYLSIYHLITFTGPLVRRISQTTPFTSHQIGPILPPYHLFQSFSLSFCLSHSFCLSPHISRAHLSLVDWKPISQSVQYILFLSNLSISHLILSFYVNLCVCMCLCFCLSPCVAFSVPPVQYMGISQIQWEVNSMLTEPRPQLESWLRMEGQLRLSEPATVD